MTGDAEELNTLRIQELILGQQIKHHILYEKDVPIHFLEVSVSGSQVCLYGVVNAQSLIEAAVSCAREQVSGCSVLSEIQMVQEYNVMP